LRDRAPREIPVTLQREAHMVLAPGRVRRSAHLLSLHRDDKMPAWSQLGYPAGLRATSRAGYKSLVKRRSSVPRMGEFCPHRRSTPMIDSIALCAARFRAGRTAAVFAS
jgi:hypothetical protein